MEETLPSGDGYGPASPRQATGTEGCHVADKDCNRLAPIYIGD